MASTISKSDSVRFDQPQDWIKYGREFRIKAKSLSVWIYIDPDNRIPWLIEPVTPMISDYPKKIVRVETRVSSSRTLSDAIPIPEETDLNAVPRTITEMIIDGRASYQLDLSNYMYLDKKFKDFRMNLDKLTDWITSITASSIRESYCDEDKTMDEWYLVFKQTGSVYEDTQIVRIRTKYQAMIKPLSMIPRKFNEWITEWEAIMAEGQWINYSDTKQVTFWARDLIKAL